MAIKTLMEVREEAKALKIENIGQYSKTQLIEEIEKKKASMTDSTVVETAEEDIDPEAEAQVQELEKAGEVEEISAEEAISPKESKLKKEKVQKAPKEKKEKAPREKKAKAPKVDIFYKFTPLGEKPEKMGDKTSEVYDALLNNKEGFSVNQIAKQLDTYYSVVDSVVKRHFKKEVVEK